jgi:hypothetical protein
MELVDKIVLPMLFCRLSKPALTFMLAKCHVDEANGSSYTVNFDESWDINPLPREAFPDWFSKGSTSCYLRCLPFEVGDLEDSDILTRYAAAYARPEAS